MARPLILVIITTIAIGALIGCSDDRATAPRPDTGITQRGHERLSGSSASIGPSEIVFCIDVSDSISATELESVVSGLGGCLSDQALIPADGRVTIVLTVYGDTIATVLGATSVTPDNLQNAILPALQGLLGNRMVAGGGFDLSGALENARTVLDQASVLDRHVLIVGSGAADDPAAALTAAEALGTAGAMVSSIAVGADDAGAALLKNCADATGGFFGLGVVCGDAFSYMLQVMIDLEPKTEELSRGEQYTATATVFRDENAGAYPIAGITVVFEVIDGPNASISDTTATDANGMATLTYDGTGGPGTDTIVGTTTHPGTGAMLTDTVTVAWLNAPPVCDAGGPYAAVVTTDTVRVTLDGGSSSDADGDSLRFRWSALCNGASFDDNEAISPILTLTGDCLCVDSVMVLLTVNDGFDSTMCEAAIRIDDRRPPIITVRESPLVVWPPNHKYQAVAPEMMIVSITDACGIPIAVSQALVVEVRSDEPDDAEGDGRTINDIEVTCPNLVNLRAERMGGGNGRVYTIVYRVFSENGVMAEAEGRVVVPHDASGKPAIDDGGNGYVITTQCVERR
jgi:hypothetical protein